MARPAPVPPSSTPPPRLPCCPPTRQVNQQLALSTTPGAKGENWGDEYAAYVHWLQAAGPAVSAPLRSCCAAAAPRLLMPGWWPPAAAQP